MMGSNYIPSYFETIEYALDCVSNWALKFAWVPHRCCKSERLIWLEHAYQGTRIITGPGTPITETFWLNKADFVIWKLKGN
jgi:hypothetical protein